MVLSSVIKVFLFLFLFFFLGTSEKTKEKSKFLAKFWSVASQKNHWTHVKNSPRNVVFKAISTLY